MRHHHGTASQLKDALLTSGNWDEACEWQLALLPAALTPKARITRARAAWMQSDRAD